MIDIEKAVQKALVYLGDGKRHRVLLTDSGGHPDALLCIGVGYLIGKKCAVYCGGNYYKLSKAGEGELLRRIESGDLNMIQVREGMNGSAATAG